MRSRMAPTLAVRASAAPRPVGPRTIRRSYGVRRERLAGDLEGCRHDPGEVLQHPVARDLDEQRVELGVGAGEGERVTLPHGVAHDLDHVAESLLDVLAPVPGGEASGERFDGPSQFAQLAALVVALRPEGPPL